MACGRTALDDLRPTSGGNELPACIVTRRRLSLAFDEIIWPDGWETTVVTEAQHRQTRRHWSRNTASHSYTNRGRAGDGHQ
jgi:hypothetical protein